MQRDKNFKLKNSKLLLFMMLFLGSDATQRELIVGQFSLIIGLALTVFLLNYQRSRELITGLCLGLCMSIKLFAWPVLLYCLIRRRIAVAAYALLTFFILIILASLLIGFDPVFEYFASIGPQVANIYRPVVYNLSVWTFSQRLFIGAASSLIHTEQVAPLIHLPDLEPVFRAVFPALFLGGAVLRSSRFEQEFYSLLLFSSLSVLIAPICWIHGFTVLLPVYWIVIARSLAQGKADRPLIALLAATLFLGSRPTALLLSGSEHSFLAGQLYLTPVIALIMLMLIPGKYNQTKATNA